MNRIEKWKDCKNLNYMSAFLGVLARATVEGCKTKIRPVTKYTHVSDGIHKYCYK